MNAFEAGKTYTTRSICDSDCIYSAEIVSRTAKTVKAIVDGELKSFRLFIFDNTECFRPFGSYSMAPTIRAA